MFIREIRISPRVAIKIWEKHGVYEVEVRELFKNGNTVFRKVGGDRYEGIGLARGSCLTAYFRYSQKTKMVEITTAYHSSYKQINYFRSKKRR